MDNTENGGETLYPKLRDFMSVAWMNYFNRYGGRVTKKDFAIACKTSETNMSRYIYGTQMPGPKMQDSIALIVGPGIYEACGASIRMPKDKILMDIATDWVDLSRDERAKLRDQAKEMAERRRKGGFSGNFVTQP